MSLWKCWRVFEPIRFFACRDWINYHVGVRNLFIHMSLCFTAPASWNCSNSFVSAQLSIRIAQNTCFCTMIWHLQKWFGTSKPLDGPPNFDLAPPKWFGNFWAVLQNLIWQLWRGFRSSKTWFGTFLGPPKFLQMIWHLQIWFGTFFRSSKYDLATFSNDLAPPNEEMVLQM